MFAVSAYGFERVSELATHFLSVSRITCAVVGAPVGSIIVCPRSAGAARSVSLREGVAMPLIHIVLVLIVVGVLLWLINSFIPMDAKIKSLLNIVVVIAVIIWLLQAFGILGPISQVRVK